MQNRRGRIFGYVRQGGGAAADRNQGYLMPDHLMPDHRLEDQMIIFVSQLEQVMSRIREKDPGLPTVQPLPLMADMLNKIIAMCERLSGTTPPSTHIRISFPDLSDVFLRTARDYPQLRVLPRAGNRIIVEALIRQPRSKSINNMQMAWLTDNQSLYRRLCEGLAACMEIYFSHYEVFFYWPAMQDRWRRMYKVFIDDLMITASEC